MALTTYIAILTIFFTKTNAARILAVSPTVPRHPEIFSDIVHELAKRGHEVLFITTNTGNLEEESLENLKKIVLEDTTNGILKENFRTGEPGEEKSIENTPKIMLEETTRVFEELMKSKEVQDLINFVDSFDLLLLPAWFRPAMIWSHIYKSPVIKVSSIGIMVDDSEDFGVPVHPFLYPSSFQQRIYNLSYWETLIEVSRRYFLGKMFEDNEEVENELVKRILGPNVASLSELKGNSHLLLLNSNSFWERNRPLPMNVVYFGRKRSEKELPEDLKQILDSPQGIIYINIGSNNPTLSLATIQMFLRVLSQLPYQVLWQCDLDDLQGIPENVLFRKWFPQSDVFRHPNMKLVITEGDTITTEDSIEAGVPLIGLPVLADQRQYIEHCVQYGIGVRLGHDVDEDQFRSTVLQVIEDPSYRENILRLRTQLYDTPISPLDNAISWIEYVLKHSGVAHLKSPASSMHWTEYYEIELITIVISSVLIFIVSVWFILKCLIKYFDAMIEYQAQLDE